jgi:hypothetical protein
MLRILEAQSSNLETIRRSYLILHVFTSSLIMITPMTVMLYNIKLISKSFILEKLIVAKLINKFPLL